MYGDIVKSNNVRKDTPFKMPTNFEISFDKQSIINKDEINEINHFKTINNDVAIIEVTITNNTKNTICYNLTSITYSTHSEQQMKDAWGSFITLPNEYKSMIKFSAADTMPGSSYTQILALEVPEGDTVATIYWKHFETIFTVDLPAPNE